MSASNVPAAQVSVTPRQLFLNHARLYPLVKSTREALYSLPFTKALADSARPSLKTIRMMEPVKVVMDQGDLIGVLTLEQLDRAIPQLKTLEIHDLTDSVCIPIENSIKSINGLIESTNTSVQASVIKPTNDTIYLFRNRVLSTVYDENGKGILSSQFDFIFGPINNNLESLISTKFTRIRSVPKASLSSEMSRTCRMLFNTLFLVRENETPLAAEVVNEAPIVEQRVESPVAITVA